MQIRCFCGCISVAPCSVRKKRQAGMCCWVQQPGRHNVLLYIVYSVFFRPLQEDYTWRSIDFIITKRVLVKLKSTWTEVFHGFSRLDASISEARSLFFFSWYSMIPSTWDKLGQSADKSLRFISDGADSRQCRTMSKHSGNWLKSLCSRPLVASKGCMLHG